MCRETSSRERIPRGFAVFLQDVVREECQILRAGVQQLLCETSSRERIQRGFVVFLQDVVPGRMPNTSRRRSMGVPRNVFSWKDTKRFCCFSSRRARRMPNTSRGRSMSVRLKRLLVKGYKEVLLFFFKTLCGKNAKYFAQAFNGCAAKRLLVKGYKEALWFFFKTLCGKNAKYFARAFNGCAVTSSLEGYKEVLWFFFKTLCGKNAEYFAQAFNECAAKRLLVEGYKEVLLFFFKALSEGRIWS